MTEDWERDRRVQTEYLRMQLDALRAGGRTRWRGRLLLEFVCRGCGDRLVEVMDLFPYRVVCTRDSSVRKGEPLSRPPAGSSVTEAREWFRAQERDAVTLQRKGEGTFFPVPSDWSPGADDGFSSACRCRSWRLRSKDVADALARGDQKRVMAPVG